MITTMKDAIVIWQSSDDMFELPVLVGRYAGSIELQQEGRSISINPKSIVEFIAVLRAVQSKSNPGEPIFTSDLEKELARARRRAVGKK